MKPHKWHKEIKAWADGAEIEFRTYVNGKWGNWVSDDLPDWQADDDWQYRIKPQPKEPQYLYVTRHPQNYSFILSEYPDNGKFHVGKIKLEVDDV